MKKEKLEAILLQLELSGGFANYIVTEDEKAETPAGRCLRGQRFLAERIQKFGNELKAIENDSRFTSQGKQEQARRLCEAVLKEIDEQLQGRIIEPVKATIEKLQGEFDKVTGNDKDDVVSFLRAQEVRALLRGKESFELENLLSQAVEAGDEVTFRAITETPIMFQTIKAGAIEKAKHQWHEKQNPVQARKLKEVTDAYSALSDTVDKIKSAINEVSGAALEVLEPME